MITLNPQLEKGSIALGEFELCSLLLINDSNYPWFILLPNRENISEIFQLSSTDQQQLMIESSFFSKILEKAFNADKINVAALGNVVPQLHIHHIARYRNDACWPDPVWGAVPSIPYTDNQQRTIIDKLQALLNAKSEQAFQWY